MSDYVVGLGKFEYECPEITILKEKHNDSIIESLGEIYLCGETGEIYTKIYDNEQKNCGWIVFDSVKNDASVLPHLVKSWENSFPF